MAFNDVAVNDLSRDDTSHQHRFAILVATASMCCYAIALILPMDVLDSGFRLPGIVVLGMSIVFCVISLPTALFALFNLCFIGSTTLIIKRGYEGYGVLRSLMVTGGAIFAGSSYLLQDGDVLASFYFWIAAFGLSSVSHWMSYRTPGTLDALEGVPETNGEG